MTDENPFDFGFEESSELSESDDSLQVITSKEIELTEEQKKFALENVDKLKLTALTRKVFKDDTIDGRSRQAIALKQFLDEHNRSPKTSERKKRNIYLTPENKEYIIRHAHDMKPVEIARIIFHNNKLHQLSAEAFAIQNYIKEEAPNALDNDDLYTDEEYVPPKTVSLTLKRINTVTGESYEWDKMNIKYKKGVEQLMKYLRSPRFVSIMNSFPSVRERSTFESEFIKTTYNKPDLTADEINLYINVVNEYLIQSRIQKIIDKLNVHLDNISEDAEDAPKISMGLASAIKDKNEEYHKSVSRQESLVKQLEGERSKRISQYREKNKSIAMLVEIFKEEEERKNLVRIAELRKKKMKEEIHRFEDEDELMARVFGITEEELLD